MSEYPLTPWLIPLAAYFLTDVIRAVQRRTAQPPADPEHDEYLQECRRELAEFDEQLPTQEKP